MQRYFIYNRQALSVSHKAHTQHLTVMPSAGYSTQGKSDYFQLNAGIVALHLL